MYRTLSALISALLAALVLHGCAALAAPALASGAASGSTGALVRAGTGSISSGAVYRTFDAPLGDVQAAVRTTLSHVQFPAAEEQADEKHVTLRTTAINRQVQIDLLPITPALTQVGITVAIGPFRKDLATATTLTDLLAEALGPSLKATARW
jgi:Protein of unknown function (DUF3568)